MDRSDVPAAPATPRDGRPEPRNQPIRSCLLPLRRGDSRRRDRAGPADEDRTSGLGAPVSETAGANARLHPVPVLRSCLLARWRGERRRRAGWAGRRGPERGTRTCASEDPQSAQRVGSPASGGSRSGVASSRCRRGERKAARPAGPADEDRSERARSARERGPRAPTPRSPPSRRPLELLDTDRVPSRRPGSDTRPTRRAFASTKWLRNVVAERSVTDRIRLESSSGSADASPGSCRMPALRDCGPRPSRTGSLRPAPAPQALLECRRRRREHDANARYWRLAHGSGRRSSRRVPRMPLARRHHRHADQRRPVDPAQVRYVGARDRHEAACTSSRARLRTAIMPRACSKTPGEVAAREVPTARELPSGFHANAFLRPSVLTALVHRACRNPFDPRSPSGI